MKTCWSEKSLSGLFVHKKPGSRKDSHDTAVWPKPLFCFPDITEKTGGSVVMDRPPASGHQPGSVWSMFVLRPASSRPLARRWFCSSTRTPDDLSPEPHLGFFPSYQSCKEPAPPPKNLHPPNPSAAMLALDQGWAHFWVLKIDGSVLVTRLMRERKNMESGQKHASIWIENWDFKTENFGIYLPELWLLISF